MATHTEKELELQLAEPQKEHDWLQKLVGDWTYETDMSSEGKPQEKAEGTERVHSLGGLWTVAEGEGQMPDGTPATTLMTLGYDPQRKKFVGTWIGSMMTHLWVYEGSLDAGERVLTLEAKGPSMTGDGKLVNYRDIIEFKSNDHRVLTSNAQGADGKWKKFMTATYRRKR